MSNANFEHSHVDYTQSTSRETTVGGKPVVDWDSVAVRTYPHITSENGGPLITRGTLKEARDEIAKAYEAAATRAAEDAGMVATGQTVETIEVSVVAENGNEQ